MYSVGPPGGSRDRCDADAGAAVLEFLTAPSGAEDFELFFEDLATIREIDAEHVEFLGAITDSGGDQHPAGTCDEVEHSEVLRESQGGRAS